MIFQLILIILLCKVVYPLARILFVYTIGKTLFSHRSKLREAGEWAIVTGASSGIGKAYACELAKDGLKLFLLGNQLKELEDTAQYITQRYGVETKIMVADFTRNDIYDPIESAVKDLSTIACLVNNVGIFYPDSLPPWPECSQVSFEFISRIAHCNMVSTASMTRIVARRMLTQRPFGPAIINMSSISSQFPMPYLSLYCSTKAFILSFTEALRQELADTSIVIQAVCPSLVATRMTQKKPSRRVPDPATFAQSALDMLGVESVTSGFIYHALMRELLTRLPLNKIKKMVRKTMEERQNKSKSCQS